MRARLKQYLNSTGGKSKTADDEVTGIEDIGLQKVKPGGID